MMTIPMDNLSTPPSRELVQRLYNKNIELENKRRKSAQARIPSDPNAWQQMRENYETIILEDHDFSELHEIEYALWQLHYRRIEEFRAHFSAALASVGSTTSQGGKGPARPDRIKKIRSQFKTFLSESTGFYHDLILKIRAKYGLPLGYFSEDPGNQIILEKDGKKSAEMKRGLLSCHRCLIYLGDLARYKGLYGEGDNKTRDYAAASSYYMQAVSLWPSSGNPHHQLAILASYAGDDLVAIYRYFRSLAVDSPFSTARDNLIIAFEKNRQSYSQLLDDAKASVVRTVPVRATGKGRKKGEAMLLSKDIKAEATSTKERTLSIPETYRAFCIRFIRLNGILFTRTSLETFGEVFSLVSRDLHELLSSGIEEELNFGSDAAENSLFIVRIISILVFTAHNVNRETEGQSYAEILQRSVLLQNAFTAAFEFMGHILERCIQLHDPSSSYLLPGILVFIEWLACHPDIAVSIDVEEKQATARSFFWNHCIAFLNKIMSSGPPMSLDNEDEACFFNMTRYDEGETGNRLAFWEDFELRGFLPLVPAQLILDFSRKHSTGTGGVNKEKRARVQRILAAGKVLANVVRIDQQGMYFDQKLKKFAIGVEPQMSEDLLNGKIHDNPVEISRISGVMQPNMSLSMGEEEEDEVIVFKPTVAEKPVDMVGPKLTTYENVSRDDWTSYVGSFASPLSNLRPENTLDASIPLNLQPTNPSASKWLMGEQASITNGMKNLGIVANGLVMNAELDEGLVASQFPALSSPFQQSGWAKDSDVMIPSKFDTIMSSKANGGSLTLRPPAASPANLKKNPVSRPVRHHGPPPGFSPVPPKPVDESIGHSDDYSWLDGYQLSSSTKDAVSNSSMNHTAHVYPHVINNNNTFSNVISFPFPGKQVPTMEVVHIQNQESWQDNQMLEHLKLYQEQQQQLQQANVQFPQGEQYQAQSLWSGRFFV